MVKYRQHQVPLGTRVGLVIMLVFLFHGIALAEPDKKGIEKYLSSEKRCGVKAQQLIDGGDYKQAIELLAQGVQKFPKSDWLVGLHGEALYLSGSLKEGEKEFRRALAMNKNNPVANAVIFVLDFPT